MQSFDIDGRHTAIVPWKATQRRRRSGHKAPAPKTGTLEVAQDGDRGRAR